MPNEEIGVRNYKCSGRANGRLCVYTGIPAVTEYIRYQHSGTFTNITEGEQVRWLPRRQASGIALPGNDFWLFDGRLIQWNHFAGDGSSQGPEISDDPGAVKLCAARPVRDPLKRSTGQAT